MAFPAGLEDSQLPPHSARIRGATNSLVYDALERVVTNTWTGSLTEHAMTLAYAYDRRNLLTNLWQAYSTGTNSVSRSYDLAGEMTSESVSLDGTVMNAFNQVWDDAGRRTTLATPGSTMAWAFQRQADGQLIQVNAAGRNCNFTYDSNGLLKTRSNPWRTQAIGRDGQGRIVTLADTVGTVTALSESMTWRADSKLTGYTATRSGTGAWNDSRSFNYNSRDQLTTEGVGLSTGVTATDTHTYDTAGLGVHVGSVLSSGSTNNWSTTLDGFSRALVETINQGSASLTASGLAVGSASVGVALNGSTQSGVLFDPKSSDGKWRVSLTAPVGTNKVIATGTLPISGNSTTATNTFIVLAQDSITDSYDNAGNLTTRTMTGSRTQTLKWDALGRLVKVQQVDAGGNGYTFASVYDGLGRRIQTIQTTLATSVAVSGSTVTVDSYFDPLVEFQELGVSVNGLRTWKVYGPDLAGGYGVQQGIGGLEATIRETDGSTTGLVSDVFGNTLATTTGWNQVNWTSMRVGGLGPVEGYELPVLSPSVSLAEAILWREKRIDPKGYYHFGVRYQYPIAGRWLTPDPRGHGISLSLYDYCGNDPLNRIDPDGRWGKAALQNTAKGFDSAWNFLGSALFVKHDSDDSFYNAAQEETFLDHFGSPFRNLGAYEPTVVTKAFVDEFSTQAGGAAQNTLLAFGMVPENETVPNDFLPPRGSGLLFEFAPKIDNNAMVHLSDSSLNAFKNGAKTDTAWVQWGDVKFLLPEEYRIGVVGAGASGYFPDAVQFIVHLPRKSDTFTPVSDWNWAGIQEYRNQVNVIPDLSLSFTVPPGPPRKHPEYYNGPIYKDEP